MASRVTGRSVLKTDNMKMLIQKLLNLFKKKIVKKVEEVKAQSVPAPAAPVQQKKKKKYYKPKPKANI